MPSASSASTHITTWQIRKKDIKSYFHFDRLVSEQALVEYCIDENSVAKHPFFPLILFTEEWTKFRKDGVRVEKKRPLRYSSRRDAAIFAYYRHLIASNYEAELKRRGIENVPIAYRKIPKADGKGNKSNIDFALDLFRKVEEFGDCDVTVVDISSYFESISHKKILEKWELLVNRKLNPAELAVFKAVTNYSTVDRELVFERLGLYDKGHGKNRKHRRMAKIDHLRSNNQRQICSPKEFRDKICGEDPNYPSLIQKNTKDYGIPQGTPISDILANINLIDFDQRLSRWVRKIGGFAYRYSDDIVVVIPKQKGIGFDAAFNYLTKAIKIHGGKLEIKEAKSAIVRFIKSKSGIAFTHIRGKSCKNGLEYLGFEFDGTTIKLRNSTLSNAWRKIKRRAYGWAKRWVKRFRAKGDVFLRTEAPIDVKLKETLRKVSFAEKDFKKWTFNKYAERCEQVFSGFELKISKQTKRYRTTAREIFELSLTKAIRKYGHAACKRKKIRL